MHSGELIVTITDIREAQGSLMAAVVDSDAAWNNQAKPVSAQKVAATKGEMTLKFADLPAGKYAVQVMHDENGNNQLDANFLGIPSEGYGFSNNPNVMRRAHFSEAVPIRCFRRRHDGHHHPPALRCPMQRRSFTQGLLLGAIAAAGPPGIPARGDPRAQMDPQAFRCGSRAHAVARRLEDGRSRVARAHAGDDRGPLAG